MKISIMKRTNSVKEYIGRVIGVGRFLRQHGFKLRLVIALSELEALRAGSQGLPFIGR